MCVESLLFSNAANELLARERPWFQSPQTRIAGSIHSRHSGRQLSPAQIPSVVLLARLDWQNTCSARENRASPPSRCLTDQRRLSRSPLSFPEWCLLPTGARRARLAEGLHPEQGRQGREAKERRRWNRAFHCRSSEWTLPFQASLPSASVLAEPSAAPTQPKGLAEPPGDA